jgi:hypothetical protein
MSYGCIVNANIAILCPTFEFNGHKWGAQIRDYSIRLAKVMHDVLNKLNGLGYAILDEWFVLNPFGELVNGHVDVLKTTLSSLKGSHLIQSLA